MADTIAGRGYGQVASPTVRWYTHGRGAKVWYASQSSSERLSTEALNAGVRAAIKTMEDGDISQDTCNQNHKDVACGIHRR